jgi:uncharacterized protein YjiS (DUF1127 family)
MASGQASEPALSSSIVMFEIINIRFTYQWADAISRAVQRNRAGNRVAQGGLRRDDPATTREEVPMSAISSPQPMVTRRREPALVRAAFAVALHGMRKFSRLLKNRRNARMMAGMDDRMLADIGLTRSDLRDAYAQPLWRDPTDVLAGRARDKRINRRGRVDVLAVDAPSIAPDGSQGATAARPSPWPYL